jgi:LmbE family N-acetylglucosaminyl deacetylase
MPGDDSGTSAVAVTLPHMDELGTILTIWAHPDDETYIAGGAMAAARDNGQRVVCVTMTAGELGTAEPEKWPPDRLGRLRRWEAVAAMAVLGVDDHRCLGLPDGALARHEDRVRQSVGELIDEVRPDTILTFGADGITFHPDHITVHRCVADAWQSRGRPGRLLYATSTVEHLGRFGPLYERWGSYMTDERPTGARREELTVHLTLDGPDLDRKVAALATMASQTGPTMSTLDPGTFAASVAEESFVDAATVRVPLGR